MKRIAWVIGINRYYFLEDSQTKKLLHLDKPASDAEEVARLLETYGDFEVHRLPITDGGQQVAPMEVLKQKDLEQAIRQLFHPTGSPIPETALLYFAGHGLQKYQDGGTEGFLAPSDANPRKDKWGISLKWLRQILETSPVRQQIIWLDCCHSGELFNFASADLGEYEKGRDRCFIAASREFQSAYGGVLTPVLLQGLDPKNNPNRWVTNYTLKDSIEEALKNAPQHPVLTNSGGQIILTGMGGVRGNICPYRGLGYFDFNDEDPKYFYGRAALTNQLVEKVQKSNFLAVLGASGSGKSSAVRAGLLHQLKMRGLPGSDRWKIYEPFTPGDRPLSSLEQVIGVKANQVEALIKAAAADRVVLVADQFEEVFTQCRDEAERQQFFECLMGAVKRLGNKLCLVLVMRSDFQGKCDEYTELAAKIDQNLVRVRQMSQEELKEAIVKPAERVGLEIDRELVNQAIADVSGSPGDLPLLQYTLTQLWEQRTLNRMTISDYTRLGGVKKALENHANLVYQDLSADEQLVAKQIFLELTHLGEGTEDTRQQVRQEDLVAEKRSPEIVEQVVQRLAKEKLIVTGEQEFEGTRVPVANIAHEALIRHWGLLGKWLKENREALLRKQDIEEAAKEWRDKGRRKDSAYLLSGQRLIEAENFGQNCAETIPLSSIAQEFVGESIKQRQKNRRFILGTVTTVILVVSGVTFYAFNQQKEAAQQTQRNLARQLAAQAELLRSQRPDLLNTATGLAVEAVQRFPSFENQQVLSQIFALLPRPIIRLSHNEGLTYSPDASYDVVAVSPDGYYLAAASRNKTVRVWEIPNGREVAHVTYNAEVNVVVFSPNSKYLAIGTSDNLAQVLQIPNGREVIRLKHGGRKAERVQKQGITHLAFSPDSRYLATARNGEFRDNFTTVWEVTSGQKMATIDPVDRPFFVRDLAFSSDQKYIATTGGDYIYLWEANNGREIVKFKPSEHKLFNVESVMFSPNSRYILAVSDAVSGPQNTRTDGNTTVWEISNSQKILQIEHKSSVASATFSSDEKYLATASFDKTARIWEISSGQEIRRFKFEVPVTDVKFSPDSKYLFTVSMDKTIRVWETNTGKEVTRRPYDASVNFVTFSPDGRYLVTASGDIWLWEAVSSPVSQTITHEGLVNAIDFSSNGKFLATASSDKTAKILDISTGQEVTRLNHEGVVRTIGFSPNGEYLATASFIQHASRRFTPLPVRIWEVSTGREVAQINSEGMIAALAFSPDSKYIVTSRDDNNPTVFQMWEVVSGRKVLEPTYEDGDEAQVYDVAFSPDGKQVATACSDKIARVMEADTGRELLRINHPESVNSVAFSPDGKYLSTASFDRTTRVWELPSGREVMRIPHEEVLEDQVFSPDSRYLATAGVDRTARVWEVFSGREVARIKHEDSVTGVAFSGDGKYLASASANTIKMELWQAKDLISEACSRLSRNFTQEEWKQYLPKESYHKTCPNLP